MKNSIPILSILFSIILLASNGFAGVPDLIPISGALYDADDQPLSGNIVLRFSVYDAEAFGSELWFEERTDFEVTDGLFAVYLGEVTSLPLEIIEQRDALWLGIAVNGEDMGRTQLGSVPYALEADVCEQLGELDSVAIQTALDSKAESDHAHTWTEIDEKPAEFTPDTHDHFWAEITDPPSVYAPDTHDHFWEEITNPPSEFTPAAHGHLWAELTDLPEGFDDDIDNIDDDVSWDEISAIIGTESDEVSAGDHNHLWSTLDNLPESLEDGDDDTTYSEVCSVGQFISELDENGTAVCSLPLNYSLGSNRVPPANNTITNLDSEDQVGPDLSITIGKDGLPIIAYFDRTNYDLKVAHCDNIYCTSANTTVPYNGSVVVEHINITIGSDGFPIISFVSNLRVRVTHCDDISCTSSSTLILNSESNAHDPSLIIGTDGLPIIPYIHNNNPEDDELKVAHCENLDCSSITLTTLATDIRNGNNHETSITIGSDGLPFFAFPDMNTEVVKVAHCDDIACTSATITTLDDASEFNDWLSVITGSDGLPAIAYRDSGNTNLKYAHCHNLACTSATITDIDTNGMAGYGVSMTYNDNGFPIMSYLGDSNLRVTTCQDLDCQSVVTHTIEDVGTTTLYFASSITIGVDGLPIIGFSHSTDRDVKVMHCNNPWCTAYMRRR